jgi:hypothetical protein
MTALSDFRRPQRLTREKAQFAAVARRTGSGQPQRMAVGIAPALVCQFPSGDHPPYTFCGAPVVDHPNGTRSPYCSLHRARCYIRYSNVRDRGGEP